MLLIHSVVCSLPTCPHGIIYGTAQILRFLNGHHQLLKTQMHMCFSSLSVMLTWSVAGDPSGVDARARRGLTLWRDPSGWSLDTSSARWFTSAGRLFLPNLLATLPIRRTRNQRRAKAKGQSTITESQNASPSGVRCVCWLLRFFLPRRWTTGSQRLRAGEQSLIRR